MIVDTHTHFYDPTRPQGVPWPPADNQLLYRTVLPAHYRELAERAGVTGTIVVEASSWLEDNQWILGLAGHHPFILGLVGHIDPNRAEFGDELARYAANPLFRGIRCGARYFENVEAGTFLSDMAQLADRDLELDVLIRDQQLDELIKLARHLPELRIVVDHIGHMAIDGAAIEPVWAERYQRLAAQPHIYMKVSALMEQSVVQPAPIDPDFYRPALDAMWQAFGQDRLIYGSNWPVCERAGTFAAGLDIVKTYFAGHGDEASAKYFWKNAQSVYRWPEPLA